jgi:integrase
MAKELTTIACEKLKARSNRYEMPDGRIGGLRIVVQPSGRKSWAFRFKAGGKSRKLTLGPFPAIGLAAAREGAGRAKDAVAGGRDPGAEKKAAKAAPTAPASVHDLVEEAVERFLSTHAKHHLRASTAREVARLLGKEIVTPWRGRRLSKIKRADVHDLLDAIVERGSPVGANRTLAWLRRLYTWALERGIVETSPCAGIKAKAAETSRERVLSDDELMAVWRAANALGQPYGAFIQMLTLTGARRNEIAGMRWQEVDFEGETFTLPKSRSKNGREHVFALADAAIEILKTCPRIGESPFVFTVAGRNPIRDFDCIKKRVDVLAPLETPWVLHDLRRTFASGCAKLGIAIHVVEKCLNHASGTFRGIVSVYQRHDFAAEQRTAFDTWSRYVESLVTGETANVLPMLRAAT